MFRVEGKKSRVEKMTDFFGRVKTFLANFIDSQVGTHVAHTIPLSKTQNLNQSRGRCTITIPFFNNSVKALLTQQTHPLQVLMY